MLKLPSHANVCCCAARYSLLAELAVCCVGRLMFDSCLTSRTTTARRMSRPRVGAHREAEGGARPSQPVQRSQSCAAGRRFCLVQLKQQMIDKLTKNGESAVPILSSMLRPGHVAALQTWVTVIRTLMPLSNNSQSKLYNSGPRSSGIKSTHFCLPFSYK